MDTDTCIIVACGATLSDIIDRHFFSRPFYEKLWPGDARGEYGDYLLWTDTGTAEMIASRYRRVVARCV